MNKQDLPKLPAKFEYRLDLRHYVTPRLLRNEPVHRWFYFPHSYSPQLVDEIIKAYPLSRNAKLLDPFVGAGTTILRAKQGGISATGVDLSPLSVFVSNTKITSYNKNDLFYLSKKITDFHKPEHISFINYPERIRKAFTQEEMAYITTIKSNILSMASDCSPFFLLALLRVQQQISRAVPDGGWFRWVEKQDQSDLVINNFMAIINSQLSDLPSPINSYPKEWLVLNQDARVLSNLNDTFNAVITSPPYPNRHDYSRIFHMELLSLGLSEEEIFEFRHASIRSHVEAKKPIYIDTNYQTPKILQNVLKLIPSGTDPRIYALLNGYFEDMYLCLKALYSKLTNDGFCAFVVGNTRHAGVMVLVDEILVELGEQVGLHLDQAWVARLRGNSAQQMAIYGRQPSRETIVIFIK